MDIYSAEKNADRFLQFAKDLSTNTSKMQHKTKERLSQLLNKYDEAIELLHNVLGDNTDDISVQVQQLSVQVANLSNEIKSLQVQPESISVESTNSDTNKSNSISVSTCKSTFQYYRSVISYVASQPTDCLEASICCRLLNEWFTARFLKSSNYNFRYNVHRIPEWMLYISIVLAYHIRDGTHIKFISDFMHWCNEIKETDANFALPYEVYQFSKQLNIRYCTPESLRLWREVTLNYYYAEQDLYDKTNIDDVMIQQYSIEQLYLKIDSDHKNIWATGYDTRPNTAISKKFHCSETQQYWKIDSFFNLIDNEINI